VAHSRGVTEVPALYFLGLPWQHTRGSALLGFVADDAAHVTRAAAQNSGRVPRPPGAPDAQAAAPHHVPN
jgi:putative flavoprotein involved in K+ transport